MFARLRKTNVLGEKNIKSFKLKVFARQYNIWMYRKRVSVQNRLRDTGWEFRTNIQ
jgi:hypothetical protein